MGVFSPTLFIAKDPVAPIDTFSDAHGKRSFLRNNDQFPDFMS
jgi:hypothetical protein